MLSNRDSNKPLDLPEWVTFPGDDWVRITPAEAGLDPERFDAFIGGLDIRGTDFGGEDHSGNKWGAVLTRGGYWCGSGETGNTGSRPLPWGRPFRGP